MLCSRVPLGFDEAVRRVRICADAGADMIFLEAPQSIDEIRAIPAVSDRPALFNLVPRGKTPEVSPAELTRLGYGLMIVPGMNIGIAAGAMRAALARAATGAAGTAGQASPRELFEAVGLTFWEGLGRRDGR